MQKIPQQTIDILHLLLADLFDEKQSRLGMMGSEAITIDLLPEEMRFERSILAAFYKAEEKELPPNPENIALLSLSKDEKILEKVRALALKANALPMIQAECIWLRSYFQQQLLSEAALAVEQIAKTDYADVAEKRDRMLDALIDLPISDNKQSFTRIEMMNYFEEEQKKRVERKAKGQALGSVLHLEKLREAAPILTPGDLTLITAPPKSGKTQTGMFLAEYNAYDNDTDVLILLLETSPTTIEERWLAKELTIPSKALRDGLVDLSKPPFKIKYDLYKAQQQQHWDEDGRIYLQYIAGSKLSEITTQIRIHKRMADARNRPLLVIVDYLQRIQKASNKTDVEAIALISNFIKDLAVRYQCHIVLFSQESFTGVNRENGDSRAHGSNTPIFVAQLHIAMRVLNATIDVQVTDGGNVPEKNALGQDRYWQHEGKQKRQSVMRYDILRANDNDTTQAYMAVENPLFIWHDISVVDPTQLPNFIQTQLKEFQKSLGDPERRLI